MKLTCERVGRFRSVFLFYNIMEEEIWKDIAGHEQRYQVSNLGNVRSIANGKNMKGVVLKKHLDSKNYHIVALCAQKSQRTTRVHRLVADAFVENPQNKPQINHINGIKTDNRVINLEWTTSKENHAHAIQTGLKSHSTVSGEKVHTCKLQIQQVVDIRKYYNDSKGTKSKNASIKKMLAEKYGVTYGNIHAIINKRSWKSL